MIDLDDWQRKQHTANKHTADMAMYQLGVKYKWNIYHPSVQLLMKVNQDIAAGFSSLARSFIKMTGQMKRMK